MWSGKHARSILFNSRGCDGTERAQMLFMRKWMMSFFAKHDENFRESDFYDFLHTERRKSFNFRNWKDDAYGAGRLR